MKLERKQIQKYLARLLKDFRTRHAYPLLVLISPVIFLMAIDPGSFSFIWFWGREIGRAGFFFLFFLVAWDWHDSKSKFKMTKTKWRYVLAGIVLVALLGLYYETVFNTDYVRVWVTSQLGVTQKSTL